MNIFTPAVRKSTFAALALCVLGIADCLFLLKLHFSVGTFNAFLCAPHSTFDCDAVNRSIYATLFGIPVAFVGLGGYLLILMLAALFFRGTKTVDGIRHDRRYVLAALGSSILGAAFAYYLLAMEMFVLKTYCPYCLLSLVTISALIILFWWTYAHTAPKRSP